MCARVEVLCHDVDVYAMDGDVLRESDGSVFKEGQVGLVVVPRWKSSILFWLQDSERPIVTSIQMLSYLSSDARMEIVGADRYVWSRCGEPQCGVERGLVSGVVDQEHTVLILPALHFFTSSFHVLIFPAL